MSKRRANRLHRLRREKRGVVLLVVVSLLTLFLMIGVTYVLVAGNYQNASAQIQRAHRYGDEPEREMEDVLGQILYGNNQFSTRSVIGPHSLLEDLYGRGDMAIGSVAFSAPVTTQNGGQTVYFPVAFTVPNPVYPIPNYYAGRVITFTNGPAAGLSTRVMAYFPGGYSGTGTPELMVEALESDLPIPVLPAQGNSFVINGAPFNGTGAGFDSTNPLGLLGKLTINGNQYDAAYLPNAGVGNIGAGGLDEPWDVPDYQNMFLAMVPPRKMSQFDNFPLLPSFHRPDLVKYWINYLSGTSLLSGSMNPRGAFLNPYGDPSLSQAQIQEIIAIKRMLLFRPLIEDNPNFTGSNQNFVADNLSGPYDVDNDGDGISDSIWVDAGLPVVTAPNGRRYKRLVAIMIKDLDGRVNPSVHGNLNLANIPTSRTSFQVTDMFAGIDPNNPYPINLPRGFGYGPAEVDLRHIFNNVTPYSTANDNAGMYLSILQQRYAPFPNPTGQAQYPGFSDGNLANVANDDGWSRLKTIGMPADHTSALSAYSTPPDVWGRAALAVDYTGQPIWGFAGTAERIDDPYEMQWNPLRASADAPYTVSELEALLRYHDLGASVPGSRLINLSGGNGGYLASEPRGTPGPSQIRREAFGMGSHIPAPKMIVPRELRQQYGNGGNSTILDLYYAAIISQRGWNQNIGSTPSDLNYAAFMAQMQTIVPFEILKGQMLNLNRELGNGIDDNGNFVIDEPGEPNEQIPTTAGPMNFDYFNDSNQATTYDHRQMMARHLYCLMMLLRNRQQNYDTDGDNNPTQAETARLFAQWAVNVVDFRDADSIMTRFEYDLDPFDANGWDASVDGDPNTQVQTSIGGVVWGLERPELLLTENMGGHDRRTLDLDTDPTKKKTTDAVMKDDDFDQELMPQGWAFIELYNPWFDKSNNSYDHKPSEIYTNGGVDLARVNGGGSPVWRIVLMHGPQHYQSDPDSPQPEALTYGVNGNPPTPGLPTVERSIYFADLNGGGVTLPGGNLGEVYFPSSNVFKPAMAGGTRIPPVMPGRYAVVGSSGNPDTGAANYGNGTYTTYIGRRTDAGTSFDPATLNLPMTRRIVLDTTNQRVQVLDNRNAGADDVTTPSDLQPVVPIPIDYVLRNSVGVAQSFTVTEPINGYLANPPPAPSVWQPPGPNDEGHFTPPADQPLDATRVGEFAFLMNDTTQVNFRTVHLQRLANPLIAWNAVTNPYLTVDTSSMDVMAYNGVTADMDPTNVIGKRNFQSFQRGGRFYASDPEAVDGYTQPANGFFRRLWQQESPYAAPTTDSPTEGGTGPHIQPRPLFNSLGYLNKRYQPYFTAMAASADVRYKGAPYFQDANGAIASPFPYFAFNNRPFNNPTELMNVPCWHSSKVLERFIFQDPTAPNWINMYQPPNAINPNVPYGHLLNFFWTATDATQNNAAEVSRIFDFVETRSPFVDTEKYYSPNQFFSGNPAPAGFRPPFNYLSRFREPGRININTIFDDNVWNAAVRGSPAMCTFPQNTGEGDGGQFLLRLAMNRQGWGSAPTDLLTTSNYDVTQPSYFSNPFRTADSADMMPNNPVTLRQTAANGGLLRRDPAKGTPGFAPPNPPPLPAYPALDGNQPLFSSESVTPYQDAARNPYFRFQPLQKIGNLFSTNSNCYAVWITVGYFEVESNGSPPVIDQAHPDGLRLAQEVGVDEGNVKRHRAFYIIDRSIPVAFEPGHRHNTDKAVLLKRFIE